MTHAHWIRGTDRPLADPALRATAKSAALLEAAAIVTALSFGLAAALHVAWLAPRPPGWDGAIELVRGTPDENHEDIVIRWGASPWLTTALAGAAYERLQRNGSVEAAGPWDEQIYLGDDGAEFVRICSLRLLADDPTNAIQKHWSDALHCVSTYQEQIEALADKLVAERAITGVILGQWWAGVSKPNA